MKEKIIILISFILIILLLKPIVVSQKTFLFLSQNFPQIPFKPLHIITSTPIHETKELRLHGEKIMVDIFLPASKKNSPAIILAMGVKTEEKDKQVLFNFADSLARLGYVVAWPRLDALATEEKMIEDPKTFVEAFQYLAETKEVHQDRISFVGFSVGSSLALVAAENPRINQHVHGFVFFGGYYNILDYLTALATRTIIVDGNPLPWKPAEGAISHAEKVLKNEVGLELSQFRNEPPPNIELLLQYSPNLDIENFKSRIFILHDRDDPYVPYIESLKLKNALTGRTDATYHLSNLFEHAQASKENLSPKLLGEFVGLFGFLYKVLMYL